MKLLELSQDQELKMQAIAARLLNKPYRFGAEVNLSDPPDKIEGLDCSELVEYLFHQVGIKVPDGSYNQYDASAEVKLEEARVGDLLFTKKNGQVNHVCLVISNTKVIEASGFEHAVVSKGIFAFTRFYALDKKRPLKSQYAGIRRLLAEKVVKI